MLHSGLHECVKNEIARVSFIFDLIAGDSSQSVLGTQANTGSGNTSNIEVC